MDVINYNLQHIIKRSNPKERILGNSKNVSLGIFENYKYLEMWSCDISS